MNRVSLIGVVSQISDVRTVREGLQMLEVRVSPPETGSGSAGGRRAAVREEHPVVLFGALALAASQELTVGARVLVDGRLRSRRWKERDGEREATSVLAHRVEVLSGSGHHEASHEVVRLDEEFPY